MSKQQPSTPTAESREAQIDRQLEMIVQIMIDQPAPRSRISDDAFYLTQERAFLLREIPGSREDKAA